MIDISNMGDDALADICEKIRKDRIQVLVAYSSALTVLADYLKRKKLLSENGMWKWFSPWARRFLRKHMT